VLVLSGKKPNNTSSSLPATTIIHASTTGTSQPDDEVKSEATDAITGTETIDAAITSTETINAAITSTETANAAITSTETANALVKSEVTVVEEDTKEVVAMAGVTAVSQDLPPESMDSEPIATTLKVEGDVKGEDKLGLANGGATQHEVAEEVEEEEEELVFDYEAKPESSEIAFQTRAESLFAEICMSLVTVSLSHIDEMEPGVRAKTYPLNCLSWPELARRCLIQHLFKLTRGISDITSLLYGPKSKNPAKEKSILALAQQRMMAK
jgi:hypothetical protein